MTIVGCLLKRDVMQVFVPELDFQSIAKVLDYRRLGKQRVETFQILRANLGMTNGWRNHPASRMWADNLPGLSAYGVAMCLEWKSRGYKDTTMDKIVELVKPDETDLPEWWGRMDIVDSHRSNLIRKAPEFYGGIWEGIPDDLPYVWVDSDSNSLV
jgi:hypothetical protein